MRSTGGAGLRRGVRRSIAAIRCSPGVEHRRQRPRDQPGNHCQPEERRIDQHAREQPAQWAVGKRTLVGFLDVLARMIDQMHVVHAGRTGGHAGKARQATVDMFDHLARRRPVLLEHLLDQVDATARGIELVAEQNISRAGRRAEPAMHAGAQDFLRGSELRVAAAARG